MANQRPCGACKHLDGRVTPQGNAYCWWTYRWRKPGETVADCSHAARPDGNAPPGQILFEGEGR